MSCNICGPMFIGKCPHGSFQRTLQSLLEDKDFEIEALRKELDDYRAALEYYADEKNWYNINKEPHQPEVRMVIGSIDTSGTKWIGGHQAREALAKYPKDKS